MNYPTVTCGGCEGSGVSPEDHGQGNIEYLGCMDCMGLGQFKMVPVDAVVLSRQPCNNCYKGKVCPGGDRHKGVHTCTLVPCPSCLGSGTTWPDEVVMRVAATLYMMDDTLETFTEVRSAMDEQAVRILDALALVVQEGTDT